MGQYKVPQDVEADDKLLGPFTFRQLIYLFITGGLCVLGYFLAQLSVFLILIPAPFAIFFVTLALPLKKDQPMETYLAAIVSFYLKPRRRFWTPGERESFIKITAPKTVEESRTRNLSSDEASDRLSFLANIIDSQGRSIHEPSTVRDELITEANNTPDMFETPTPSIDRMVANTTTSQHATIVNQMKASIEANSRPLTSQNNLHAIRPLSDQRANLYPTAKSFPAPKLPQTQPTPQKPPVQSQPMIDLANNSSLSVETIAKQANRLQHSNIDDTNETIISLH